MNRHTFTLMIGKVAPSRLRCSGAHVPSCRVEPPRVASILCWRTGRTQIIRISQQGHYPNNRAADAIELETSDQESITSTGNRPLTNQEPEAMAMVALHLGGRRLSPQYSAQTSTLVGFRERTRHVDLSSNSLTEVPIGCR